MDRSGIVNGDSSLPAIAVIGMSGCLPGARDLDAFWRNLLEARESIRQLGQNEQQARKTNGSPQDSHWVNRSAILQDRGRFDADFFGFSASEAQLMDPQHRYFLEHAWLAMEDATCPHE